jgi:hypothetical protein
MNWPRWLARELRDPQSDALEGCRTRSCTSRAGKTRASELGVIATSIASSTVRALGDPAHRRPRPLLTGRQRAHLRHKLVRAKRWARYVSRANVTPASCGSVREVVFEGDDGDEDLPADGSTAVGQFKSKRPLS